MSLALYLQMVGRGLRPKADGGNCIILDLAANSVTQACLRSTGNGRWNRVERKRPARLRLWPVSTMRNCITRRQP